MKNPQPISFVRHCTQKLLEKKHPAVAEWLEAWDTLTMFEAAVCGRS